jgi:uncharacterized protein (DUF2461 family)
LHSSRDQVERYRAAVHRETEGGELAELVAGLCGRGYDVIGERLATQPRGVPADHPRRELLRHRSLVAARPLGREAWIHTPEALERVRVEWRALTPLVEWFSAHVGARRERRG